MLIGLASCMLLEACDTENGKPVQPVWDTLLARLPAGAGLDGLLLAGDQVYSGYGPGDALFKPQLKMSAQAFLDLMDGQYRGQFEVPQFQKLLARVARGGDGLRRVGMVWDDHDFGYNAGFGKDPRFSVEKKRVTRHLFRMFRDALQGFNPGAQYPAKPTLAEVNADTSDEGVGQVLDWPGARIFLPDQRFHADSSKAPDPKRIMRPGDWTALEQGLRANDAWSVLVSGRPVSVAQKLRQDYWMMYVEGPQLLAVAAQKRNVIALCGDLHRNMPPIAHPGMLEIICSGAAQEQGGKRENFGLLELQPDQAQVRLYERGSTQPQYQASFARQGVVAGGALAQQTLIAAAPASAPAPAATPAPVAVQEVERELTFSANVAAAPFSTRFLVTNRVIEGDKPTDDVSQQLGYFYFPGTQLQMDKRSLQGWTRVDGPEFFELAARASLDLAARQGALPQQLCVFVHGNRKTSEAVIAQYVELDALCFNAQGAGALGVCIAFDWATRDSGNVFKLEEVYRENIARVPGAAALLAELLAQAREVADLAGVDLTVMAHSLGNRVAAGALERLQALSPRRPLVEHYMANCADLPATVFDGEPGRGLRDSCGAITVPFTGQDDTLKLAEKKVPEGGLRLGRRGGASFANVCFKDISTMCHPMDPHSGLFMAPWTSGEQGPLITGFSHAMKDYRWP